MRHVAPTGVDTVIDWIELRERLCGDEELVETIVELFVEECPAWLAEIVDAVEAADFERIRTSAHTLKGAAGNLSAHSLTAIASRLEQLSAEGNLPACSAACAELSAECDRLLRTLGQPRVH
jgi:two-component system sensor histidine kinase/response regulator